MDLRILPLPRPTSCPACGERVEQMLVELVFSEKIEELEVVAVSCPECGTSYDFDLTTLMQAVALEAVKGLRQAP